MQCGKRMDKRDVATRLKVQGVRQKSNVIKAVFRSLKAAHTMLVKLTPVAAQQPCQQPKGGRGHKKVLFKKSKKNRV